MKKVYFNVRPASRERMWDTPKNASDVCDILLPSGVCQKSSISTFNSSSVKNKFISKIKYELSKYIINCQNIDMVMAEEAELLYMWGAFPKNSDKPFILELDNPYTPAYYHLENFKRNKEKIKVQLDKAYKLSFMSETSMNHFIELYGYQYKNKSFINYPYMKKNYISNQKKEFIDFIFVGMDFRRKGGVELLEAFSNVKSNHIRLTFVSKIDKSIQSLYESDSRINFLPLQPRDVLFNDIYPNMDVMIFPSFHESFGVVLLEGLSFGMGIITVNTYATHEIVIDDFNGKLLKHPFLKPSSLNSQQIINCVDERIGYFNARYLSNNEFYFGLYKDLKKSIEESITDYRDWKENSIKQFNTKFSPAVWQENFKKIIE